MQNKSIAIATTLNEAFVKETVFVKIAMHMPKA